MILSHLFFIEGNIFETYIQNAPFLCHGMGSIGAEVNKDLIELIGKTVDLG